MRDKCPQCGQNAMPKWNPDPRSAENARMCQDCGYMETKMPNYSTGGATSSTTLKYEVTDVRHD